MLQSCSPSSMQEAQVGRSHVWDQHDLHSKSMASQGYIVKPSFKKYVCMAGGGWEAGGFRLREMAQQWRTLAILPEDLDLIPSTHRVVHNCLHLQFEGIQSPLLATSGTSHTNIYTGKTPIHTHTQKKKYRFLLLFWVFVFFKSLCWPGWPWICLSLPPEHWD